jgi:hypothetical protein
VYHIPDRAEQSRSSRDASDTHRRRRASPSPPRSTRPTGSSHRNVFNNVFDTGAPAFVRAGGGGGSSGGGSGKEGTRDERERDERERDVGRSSSSQSRSSSRRGDASEARLREVAQRMKAERDAKGGSIVMERAPAVTTRTGAKKDRRMDAMLEKLKRVQAARAEHRDAGHTHLLPAAGSMPRGSQETTNLHVGNVAHSVDERGLLEAFGPYGPVASVKIMWPRSDEPRGVSKHGFIAYMTREDADTARRSMDGTSFHGLTLQVGWAKAIVLPKRALYVHGESVLPHQQPQHASPAAATALTPQTALSSASGGTRASVVRVVRPRSDERTRLIHRVAAFVAREGAPFATRLQIREAANAQYAFLFQTGEPDNTYYTWKVVSLARGDEMHTWRRDPFQLVPSGPVWHPPEWFDVKALEDSANDKAPSSSAAVGESGGEGGERGRGGRKRSRDRGRERDEGPPAKRRRARRDRLDERDVTEWIDILRQVTPSRKTIMRAMGWALDVRAGITSPVPCVCGCMRVCVCLCLCVY